MRPFLSLITGLLASLLGAAPAFASTVPATATTGARAFDFFHGHWEVHNRRLLKPLQQSGEWEEFDATIDCTPILNGAGNQDVFLSPHRPGVVGMSLTLFDPAAQRWSSYWVDSRSVVLQPAVSGTFAGITAVLEGDDEYKGKPLRVRNTWSRTDTATPRWEQSYSLDQGKTWETNWVMDLRRAAPNSHPQKR